MTQRPDTGGVDPWEIPLRDLGALARARAEPNLYRMTVAGDDEARRQDAELLLGILQARATLEASTKATATARRLVFATWALVGATVVLALVAIFA